MSRTTMTRILRSLTLLAWAALILAVARPAMAEDAPKAPQVVEEPATAALSLTSVEKGTKAGGLGDTFLVQMGKGDGVKLQRWAVARGKKMGVFFDGHLLKGISVTSVSVTNEDMLRFELQRTDENRDVLDPLLGGRLFAARTIAVQVGLDDGSALSTYTPLSLVTMPHKRKGIMVLVGSAVLILTLLYLGARTSMLRDGTPADKKKLGTYSLARVQSAFWFANIAIAFLWIWAFTGAVDTVSDSSLVLMGIGSGTALGAKLIDQRVGNDAPAPEVLESQGFLDDLLTDENGYALHRFQMAVWTIILGFVFWGSVYRHLSMPQFDATLLGLMGISSGTYLGFKLPEKRGKENESGKESAKESGKESAKESGNEDAAGKGSEGEKG